MILGGRLRECRSLLNIAWRVRMVARGDWMEMPKFGADLAFHDVDQMVAHPRLIERPIVLSGERAAIGRPPESVLEIL